MAKLKTPPKELLDIFNKIEDEVGIPRGLLAPLARIESDFDATASTNKSSAKGMFQQIKSTRERYGVTNPFDVVQSATAAAKYLKDNLKMFKGDVSKAILAYHAGEGNVQKYGLDTSRMPEAVSRNYLQAFNKASKNLGTGASLASSSSSKEKEGEIPHSQNNSYVYNDTFNKPNEKIAGSVQQNNTQTSQYSLPAISFGDEPIQANNVRNLPTANDNSSYLSNEDVQKNNVDTLSLPTQDSNAVNNLSTNNQQNNTQTSQYSLPAISFDDEPKQSYNNTNTNVVNEQQASLPAQENITSQNQGVINDTTTQNISNGNTDGFNPNTGVYQTDDNTGSNSQNSNDFSNIDNVNQVPTNNNGAVNNISDNNRQVPQSLNTTNQVNKEENLFDRFASLSPQKQVDYYMSLPETQKEVLRKTISQFTNQPDVDHPGFLANLGMGAINEANKIMYGFNQKIGRATQSVGQLLGSEGIEKSGENIALDATQKIRRNNAINELNDAVNPSVGRTIGQVGTDVGTALLTPVGKGGLVARGALQGGVGSLITSTSDSEDLSTYLGETLLDTAVGAGLGAGGAKLINYLSNKTKGLIPETAQKMKDLADKYGINYPNAVIPELKDSLKRYVDKFSSSDKRIYESLVKSSNQIESELKKLSGSYKGFVNKKGQPTTSVDFFEETYPELSKLRNVADDQLTQTPYASQAKKAFDKVSSANTPEDLIKANMEAKILSNKIESSKLYDNLKDARKAITIKSSDDLTSSLEDRLSDIAVHGSSGQEKAVKNILSSFSDDMSLEKLLNKRSDLSSLAAKADGEKEVVPYRIAIGEIDNFLNRKSAFDPKFKQIMDDYNKSQTFNKIKIQDVTNDKDFLAKLVDPKNSADDVANIITNFKKPEEFEKMWKFMDVTTRNSVRQGILDNLIKKSTNKAGQFNPSAFMSNIEKATSKTSETNVINDVVFKNKRVFNELAQLSKNIDNNITYSPKNGYEVANMIKNAVGLAAIGGVTAGVQYDSPLIAGGSAGAAVAAFLLRRNSSRLLTDTKLRREMFELNKLNPKSKEFEDGLNRMLVQLEKDALQSTEKANTTNIGAK